MKPRHNGKTFLGRTQDDGCYQGLIGERVRVVDGPCGAVHVTWLAGASQRRNDLVMVLTAEQLGLTRVQGNACGHKTGQRGCQESLPQPHY